MFSQVCVKSLTEEKKVLSHLLTHSGSVSEMHGRLFAFSPPTKYSVDTLMSLLKDHNVFIIRPAL